MAIDCLTQATPKEKKDCLRGKIATFASRSDDFHTSIRDAMLDATLPGIDYKLTQLTAILKELTKKEPFSIGRFFCDLMLSIVLGPLLDRMVGKFIIGPLKAIAFTREGLEDFAKKSIGTTMRRQTSLTADTREALAEIGVSALAIKRAGTVMELPGFMPRESYLKGMWTEIAIDSFEGLYHNLLVVAQTPGITPPEGTRMSLAMSTADFEPTPLEFVAMQARGYYNVQKRINEITRFTLETILELAESDKLIAQFQSTLDGLNASFDDFAREDASREIKNIVKMVLALFYFGDPKQWGSDKDVTRLGRWEDAMKAFEVVEDPRSRGYLPYNMVIYPYRIKLPAELKSMLLRNILVPGENKSFLAFYTKLKSDYYSRPVFTQEGYGIERKLGHSELEPVPNRSVDISDPLSPWYTAEETAFNQLQQSMQRVYNELTSNGYDNFFMTMLANRGKLPSAPMFPSAGKFGRGR